MTPATLPLRWRARGMILAPRRIGHQESREEAFAARVAAPG